MRLGLQKTTLVDYPGMVAATVFTAGCNLRCPYCHNPDLVHGPAPDEFLPYADILAFLSRRKLVLGGVCITGGEPLLNPWLPDLANEIHTLGLKVKLDTNGLLPDRIGPVQADYIALDIKTSPAKYDRVGLSEGAPLARAVDAVRHGAAEFEFRTTVVDPVVGESDIKDIVALLRPGERYTIAAFRPGTTLDPAYRNKQSPSLETLDLYAAIARDAGLLVTVRDPGR